VKKPGCSQIARAEECLMEGHFFYPVSKKPGSLVQGNHELNLNLAGLILLDSRRMPEEVRDRTNPAQL